MMLTLETIKKNTDIIFECFHDGSDFGDFLEFIEGKEDTVENLLYKFKDLDNEEFLSVVYAYELESFKSNGELLSQIAEFLNDGGTFSDSNDNYSIYRALKTYKYVKEFDGVICNIKKSM